MNIIEAIQAGKEGKLITNKEMLFHNRFLKYQKYEYGNTFVEYKFLNKTPVYQNGVTTFTIDEVIRNDWEIFELDKK